MSSICLHTKKVRLKKKTKYKCLFLTDSYYLVLSYVKGLSILACPQQSKLSLPNVFHTLAEMVNNFFFFFCPQSQEHADKLFLFLSKSLVYLYTSRVRNQGNQFRPGIYEVSIWSEKKKKIVFNNNVFYKFCSPCYRPKRCKRST